MTTLYLSHQRRAAAAQLGLSVLCSSKVGLVGSQTDWRTALKRFYVVPKVAVEVKMLSTTGPGKRISSQPGDSDSESEPILLTSDQQLHTDTNELAIGYVCYFDPGKNSYSI